MKQSFRYKAFAAAVLLLLMLLGGAGAVYSLLTRPAFTAKAADAAGGSSVSDAVQASPDAWQQKVSGLFAPLQKVAHKINGKCDRVQVYCDQKNIATVYTNYIYGRWYRLLGRKLVEAKDVYNVYSMQNGHLTFRLHYDMEQAEEALGRIGSFADYVQAQNAAFLFYITANKETEQQQFPTGLVSEYPALESLFTEYLTDRQIPFLKGKDVLLRENGDLFSWFYKTDHHWTPRAGLVVARSIVDKAAADFGLTLDQTFLSADLYTTEMLSGYWLGSQGQRATHGYIAPDDFELLHPTFDTQFHVEMPDMDKQTDGTFDETMYYRKRLDPGYYSNDSYSVFLYGDRPFTHIENLRSANDSRILVIKHSKARVVNPFLALTCKTLDIIDPRYYKESIREYIDRMHPDLVVVMLGLDGDYAWAIQ